MFETSSGGLRRAALLAAVAAGALGGARLGRASEAAPPQPQGLRPGQSFVWLERGAPLRMDYDGSQYAFDNLRGWVQVPRARAYRPPRDPGVVPTSALLPDPPGVRLEPLPPLSAGQSYVWMDKGNLRRKDYDGASYEFSFRDRRWFQPPSAGGVRVLPGAAVVSVATFEGAGPGPQPAAAKPAGARSAPRARLQAAAAGAGREATVKITAYIQRGVDGVDEASFREFISKINDYYRDNDIAVSFTPERIEWYDESESCGSDVYGNDVILCVGPGKKAGGYRGPPYFVVGANTDPPYHFTDIGVRSAVHELAHFLGFQDLYWLRSLPPSVAPAMENNLMIYHYDPPFVFESRARKVLNMNARLLAEGGRDAILYPKKRVPFRLKLEIEGAANQGCDVYTRDRDPLESKSKLRAAPSLRATTDAGGAFLMEVIGGDSEDKNFDLYRVACGSKEYWANSLAVEDCYQAFGGNVAAAVCPIRCSTPGEWCAFSPGTPEQAPPGGACALAAEVKRYDANGDCAIEKSEAVKAITDFFAGTITKPQAVAVVVAGFEERRLPECAASDVEWEDKGCGQCDGTTSRIFKAKPKASCSGGPRQRCVPDAGCRRAAPSCRTVQLPRNPRNPTCTCCYDSSGSLDTRLGSCEPSLCN